jgi:hypothetical protein
LLRMAFGARASEEDRCDVQQGVLAHEIALLGLALAG